MTAKPCFKYTHLLKKNYENYYCPLNQSWERRGRNDFLIGSSQRSCFSPNFLDLIQDDQLIHSDGNTIHTVNKKMQCIYFSGDVLNQTYDGLKGKF